MSPETWLERKSFFLMISSGVTLTKRSLKLQSLAWQPLPRYNSTTIPSTSTSQGTYCGSIYMVHIARQCGCHVNSILIFYCGDWADVTTSFKIWSNRLLCFDCVPCVENDWFGRGNATLRHTEVKSFDLIKHNLTTSICGSDSMISP